MHINYGKTLCCHPGLEPGAFLYTGLFCISFEKDFLNAEIAEDFAESAESAKEFRKDYSSYFVFAKCFEKGPGSSPG